MTNIPVICSAPMVRALLDRRKTMTRRLRWSGKVAADSEGFRPSIWTRVKPGDRLWVRETWRIADKYDRSKPRNLDPRSMTVIFDVGGSIANAGDGWCVDAWPPSGDAPAWAGKKRSPLHLPLWASRLTLTVISTKIERLNAISNDDAEAEGIESYAADQALLYRNYASANAWFCTWPGGLNDPHAYVPADQIQRRSFQSLWESLHGAGAWAKNPDVVALTFAVHQSNIDVAPKESVAR